ncbi:MAG: LysR substrate-binding domain-containing protein [Pseudomonadota bacterium]
MDGISLKQLRYAEALAAHGHFGRAATACAISQPALSTQIKALEEAMGALLFERAARTVRPTRIGQDFIARTREILRAVDDLKDLTRISAQGLSGRLRVGLIPTLAPYLLPAFIRELAESHPAIEPHVREATTPRLVEELLDGRLDVALVALPIDEPALSERPLFTEGLALVRHASQADAPLPERDRLAEEKLLLLEEGHCFRDQALAFCSPAARPRGQLDASSLSTLVEMVGAGLGVTLIPEMAVAAEGRRASVCIRPLDDPKLARTIGLLWRRSSPLADPFAEIAQAAVRAGARVGAHPVSPEAFGQKG